MAAISAWRRAGTSECKGSVSRGGAARWNKRRAKPSDGDVSARIKLVPTGISHSLRQHKPCRQKPRASRWNARLRQLVLSAACAGVLEDWAPTAELTFVAIGLVGARTGALQCHLVFDLDGGRLVLR